MEYFTIEEDFRLFVHRIRLCNTSSGMDICMPCGVDVDKGLNRLKNDLLEPLEIVGILRTLSSAHKRCPCSGLTNCFDLLNNPPTKLRDDFVGQYGSRPNPDGRALGTVEL